MSAIHKDPVFCCDDRDVMGRFLSRYSIAPGDEPSTLIEKCARAFSNIPYENLTKIIKSDLVLNRASALRLPAEVLADHLNYGTGGTCFSLTAALIAVFNALAIEAQPLLADRRYGPDTHCGLAVRHDGQWILIDPGFLLFDPTPIPTSAVSVIHLGHATVELRPIDSGDRIELSTTANGTRKVRLVYRRSPVDAENFTRAWIDSFTWEMMTYPVLTRSVAGRHIYLQGASSMIRSPEQTIRSKLQSSEQLDFIGRNMGINREIVLRAWKVIRHGAA